jgi:capsular polysaccharide biosynthesis protein/GGDEF domain-containing protein
MELKDYVQIVRKRWWLVAATFVATTILTLLFVNAQPWIYESTTTLVVRPRTSISEDAVRAIDILSRRVEITSTYSNIARSRLIRDRAIEALELTSEERSGLKVTGRVVTGSNLLEIGVLGTDPDTVAAFARTVGNETLAYIAGLDEAFELTVLDEARTPTRPIAPNKRFTVVLGAAFGLVLGVGLALLVEKLGWPVPGGVRFSRTPRSADRFNIVDRDTNVYNEAYLLMRYDQEIARSRRSDPVCLGFLEVQARDTETGVLGTPSRRNLRAVVETIQPTVRDEDLLAHLGSGSFVVMLPEVDPEYAEQLLEEWAQEVVGPAADGRSWLEASVGTGVFGGDATTASGEQQEAAPVIEEAAPVEEVEDEPTGEMNARDVMFQILSSGDHG